MVCCLRRDVHACAEDEWFFYEEKEEHDHGLKSGSFTGT